MKLQHHKDRLIHLNGDAFTITMKHIYIFDNKQDTRNKGYNCPVFTILFPIFYVILKVVHLL